MGVREAVPQFLILREESHVEPAKSIFGERRKCITAQQALNGSRNDLDGADVLIWGTPDHQHIQWDRALALELAPDCARVRLFDMTKPTASMMTAPEAVKSKWNYDALSAAAQTLGFILTIEKPPSDEAEPTNGPPPEQSLGNPPLPADLAVSDGGPPLLDMPDLLPVDAYANEYAPEYVETRIDYEEKPHSLGDPGWPMPLDLTQSLYKGRPLPLNLVPAVLRPLIADCSKRTGIDAAAFFCGFLGAISGIASDFIRVQPKQRDHRWSVRGVIWPFAIGDSSSGKTTGLEEGMRWIQKKDQAAILENVRKMKEYQHALDIYTDECMAARKSKAQRPENEPEHPVLKEFWVSRGTTEGVTRLLQHSPKVTWYMDEASGLINGWDRYAAGGKGSGDREFVLMLWNGGPGKNTLAGKTITMENASAVLCGGSTPTAMLKCAGGKLQSDGFLQRTLLCMIPNKGRGSDAEPDESAYDAYERILDGLLDMHSHPAATLRLSPDAGLIYAEFMDTLEQRIKSEESEPLRFHLGKWDGIAPRLMLLYYLIEKSQHGQIISDGEQIPAEIAHQVCKLLMDWQLSHLQEFWYELMADKVGRKFSQTIARYIVANPQLTVLEFRTHCARPHWRELEALKPWEIKEAMNALINAGWLTPNTIKTNSYGVAPSYDINPAIQHMFTEQRETEIASRAVKREELLQKRLHSDD